MIQTAAIRRTVLLTPASLFVLAPPLAMVVTSFCRSRFPSLPWPGWSSQWYRAMVHDQTLMVSVLRSLLIGGGAATVGVTIGFPSGYALARCSARTTGALLAVFTVPALLPFLLFGLGLLQFVRVLGIDRSLGAVLLGHIAVFSPIAMALCFHRCRRLDIRIESAARELGCSELRLMLQIVGGQMWRTVLAGMAIIFVLSWDEFIIAWFVSGFQKTYPVEVRNMLESTMSPEIDAIGVTVAIGMCLSVLVASALLKEE